MINLGMSLVGTSSLNNEFQNIATILNGGELPTLVWAVFYEKNLIAIHMSPTAAFSRLELVIEGLNVDQLPEVQTQLEAECSLDTTADEFANAPRYNPESVYVGSQEK